MFPIAGPPVLSVAAAVINGVHTVCQPSCTVGDLLVFATPVMTVPSSMQHNCSASTDVCVRDGTRQLRVLECGDRFEETRARVVYTLANAVHTGLR